MASFARAARLGGWMGLGTVSLLLWSLEARAEGIIDQPGNHPSYSVELDPHLVIQHSATPVWYDEGVGLGLRATIPFLDGPIKTINNSMGISFGLDWAHFGDNNCYNYYYWEYRNNPPDIYWDHGCRGDSFIVPVALQWNFWLTDIISVFGEPGLAVQYNRWDGLCYYANNWRDCHDDDFDFLPVTFWAGGRFLFGDTVGMTVRLGYPSVTIGATFLL
jgi:hypothetical protein